MALFYSAASILTLVLSKIGRAKACLFKWVGWKADSY